MENSYYTSASWMIENGEPIDFYQTNQVRIDQNDELITKMVRGPFESGSSEIAYCRWHEKKVSCSDLPAEYHPPEGCN